MRTPAGRKSLDKVWTETKLAVRAYSRNPSKGNESQVRMACSRLRDEGAAVTRKPREVQVETSARGHK